MKNVILRAADGNIDQDNILISDVPSNTPVFAKEGNIISGLIIRDDDGWVLKLGGWLGATGHHETREKVIGSCLPYGYSFCIDVDSGE